MVVQSDSMPKLRKLYKKHCWLSDKKTITTTKTNKEIFMWPFFKTRNHSSKTQYPSTITINKKRYKELIF